MVWLRYEVELIIYNNKHTDTLGVNGMSFDKEDPVMVSVLLNARPLNTVFTGVARYARTLYQHISLAGGVRVSYFCNGRINDTMPEQARDAMSRHFPVWVRHIARWARVVVEDKLLQRYFRNKAFGIYHETGLFPLTTSTLTPVVLTIYDLSLITYPECHPSDRVKHFERYFYKRLPSVNHVITISEFIREEIISILNISPDKVTAIPLAASSIFFKRNAEDVRRYLDLQGIPARYILTVGTREPRKNLIGLVRAYSRIKTDIPLLCVGWSGWMNETLPIEIERLRLKGRVRLLGHVSDEELAQLYSGALVSVYPSLYEGFGLPILEAMACDCPVVCSNRSSMPEVAGNAAHLIEPEDEKDIVRGLSEMIYDDKLREAYVDSGRNRAMQFSWDKTARQTIDVFRQVASRA